MFTLHFSVDKAIITHWSSKKKTFKNENSPPDFEPLDLAGCRS